jgi:hypothetical protein
MKYLTCENCKQTVAKFDPKEVKMPVDSTMFRPRDGDHMVWFVTLQAADMNCPICKKRVFHDPYPKRLVASDTVDGNKPHEIDLMEE